MSVVTERLELVPLPPAAAAALPHDREGAARLLGHGISRDWPGADVLGLIARQAALTADEAMWRMWLIVDRNDNEVVGDFVFMGPPSRSGIVGIAYGVVPSHRRRGYATEAARALLAWAQRQPGVKAVHAACLDDNHASIRTLRRVGFRERGKSGRELRWRL